MLHESACYSSSAKFRINSKTMHNNGRFIVIPISLDIIRFGIAGDSNNSGKAVADLSDPKLSALDVLPEDLGVGISVVPLQITFRSHQRHYSTHQSCQRDEVVPSRKPDLHSLSLSHPRALRLCRARILHHAESFSHESLEARF